MGFIFCAMAIYFGLIVGSGVAVEPSLEPMPTAVDIEYYESAPDYESDSD